MGPHRRSNTHTSRVPHESSNTQQKRAFKELQITPPFSLTRRLGTEDQSHIPSSRWLWTRTSLSTLVCHSSKPHTAPVVSLLYRMVHNHKGVVLPGRWCPCLWCGLWRQPGLQAGRAALCSLAPPSGQHWKPAADTRPATQTSGERRQQSAVCVCV